MMCVHVVDIRECRECQQQQESEARTSSAIETQLRAEGLIYLEGLAYGLQRRPGFITAAEVGAILEQMVRLFK